MKQRTWTSDVGLAQVRVVRVQSARLSILARRVDLLVCTEGQALLFTIFVIVRAAGRVTNERRDANND